MSRALWLVLACGCYDPAPVEELACSETGHCPTGQACDSVFHVCAASPVCRMPAIVDPLAVDTDTPCMPWGSAFGHALFGEIEGAFAITPIADSESSGGCVAKTSIRFEPGGIFLEVPAVMPAPRGITLFRVSGGASPVIIVHDNKIELATDAESIVTMPYDANAMRWWRLRPDRVAQTTIGEYSADGRHWSQLGAVDLEPQDEVILEFSAGVSAADPTANSARFRNLGVCPPL